MCDVLFIRKIDLCYRQFVNLCLFVVSLKTLDLDNPFVIEFSEINIKRTIEHIMVALIVYIIVDFAIWFSSLDFQFSTFNRMRFH